jgi:hypothetical protein
MKESKVVTSALGDDAGIVGSARSILDFVSQRGGDEPAS